MPRCASSIGEGQKGWAGIYWQHPDKNWGDEIGLNLVGAKKISFYAKGERGGEIVEFISGGIATEIRVSRIRMHTKRSLGQDSADEHVDEVRHRPLQILRPRTSPVSSARFAWVAVGGYDKEGRLVTYLAEMKVE